MPEPAEPVIIFEGSDGYEVHIDGGHFTVVDAELGREWSPLSLHKITALHKVIGAALGADGPTAVRVVEIAVRRGAERDAARARLAEAEALLRPARDFLNTDEWFGRLELAVAIDAFLAAGDPDA